MARPRRSRGRRRVRVRKRGDWCYRCTVPGEGEPLIGSYDGEVQHTLLNGVSTAQIMVLYDSVDAMTSPMRLSTVSFLPRAARAEGRNPFIIACELDVCFRPLTWSANAFSMLGIRLGIFDQDNVDSIPAVSNEYTMWANSPDVSQPSVDANDRVMNIRDWRLYWAFNAEVTAPAFHFRRFLRVNRRLPSSSQCLGLYLETPEGNTDLRYFINCRTLVADEG